MLPHGVLHGKRVAVVVPAFREQQRVGRTLRTLPEFVDAVYVVDDASDDATAAEALAVGDERVRLLRHARNRGVGAAIVTGYVAAVSDGADVAAVMAGDGQMDPRELCAVVEPVVLGRADYVKGNRFLSPDERRMPWPRRLAGKVLSAVTRWASGLDISDSQCGFTAIGRRALLRLDWDELWPRFGYPNDLLLLLAGFGLCVREVPVRPIYAGEASGVRAWHVFVILWLIARRVWLRSWQKHAARGHRLGQHRSRAAHEAGSSAVK
jgi:glycosyltransferase involved in cell wall biosynthesis